MKYLVIIGLLISGILVSCGDNDENCQTCILEGCGIVGCEVLETREVCDEEVATALEESSEDPFIWRCE